MLRQNRARFWGRDGKKGLVRWRVCVLPFYGRGKLAVSCRVVCFPVSMAFSVVKTINWRDFWEGV